MNLSPLQVDTYLNSNAHYYPTYYNHEMSSWTTSLLCPSTPDHYPSTIPSMPFPLQSIENYCAADAYYMPNNETIPNLSENQFNGYLSQHCVPSVTTSSSHNYYSPEDNKTSIKSDFSPNNGFVLPQHRANYTRHQLIMLNEIFKEHKYPNSLQKTLIANYIGVSRDQIRIWFQNKRRKVQLIKKGQAKKTKTDVECEYGEYRRHLPKNFLSDLFGELYKARGAPARLPVKRDNAKSVPTEQTSVSSSSHCMNYSTIPQMVYYPQDPTMDHDDLSNDAHIEHYSATYPSQNFPSHV